MITEQFLIFYVGTVIKFKQMLEANNVPDAASEHFWVYWRNQ